MGTSYENSNFPVSGEGSLDGVWVAVYNVESSAVGDLGPQESLPAPIVTEGGDFAPITIGAGDITGGESIHIESDKKSIDIEILSIKENLADGTLLVNDCSIEPVSGFGVPLDVISDDDGNRKSLSVFGEEIASIDSATKISILEDEYSYDGGDSASTSSSTYRSVGALIKISDTYKESIGTITIGGESRDSSCFAIEYVTRIEEIVENDEVSNSTQEFVGVMFNEEDFIKGEIYDTISGSGDYDDYFEAEFYVYDPEEFIDPAGSDGEAGYLELSEDGLMNFSGESEVILRFGGAINISFDFNLL